MPEKRDSNLFEAIHHRYYLKEQSQMTPAGHGPVGPKTLGPTVAYSERHFYPLIDLLHY